MSNPEFLATDGGPDLIAQEDSQPIEGESFTNLQRFLQYGAIAPLKLFGPGNKPDYSDRNLYYPGGKGTQLVKWERGVRITYDYVFGDKTRGQIASEEKIDAKTIRDQIRTTVIKLWQQAPEEVKLKFPLESFDFKKPWTITSRQRASLAHGGTGIIGGKSSQQQNQKKPKILPYPENLATGAGPDSFAQETEKAKVLPYKSWDNTIGFLQGLTFEIKKPSEYIPPLYRNTQAIENYERNLALAGKIFGLVYKNVSEAGRDNKLTRERVRQIAEHNLDQLWEYASDGLKDKYPRDLLSVDKRTSLIWGTYAPVVAGLEQGLSTRELTAATGGSSLYWARKSLRKVGIDVPFAQDKLLEDFKGLANTEATDEQIQALLNRISNHRQIDILKKAGLIVGQLTIARTVGLFPILAQFHRISESLGRENLPQIAFPHKNKEGIILAYYRVIAKVDEDSAIAILKHDRSLDDLRINPVTQIAGPKSKDLPNTTRLASEEFRPFGKLLTEILGRRWAGYRKVKARILQLAHQ